MNIALPFLDICTNLTSNVGLVIFLGDEVFVRIGQHNLKALFIPSNKGCVASFIMLSLLMMSSKFVCTRLNFIECRQSVLIDQSIMNTFIHVFRRISTEEIFAIKENLKMVWNIGYYHARFKVTWFINEEIIN